MSEPTLPPIVFATSKQQPTPQLYYRVPHHADCFGRFGHVDWTRAEQLQIVNWAGNSLEAIDTIEAAKQAAKNRP